MSATDAPRSELLAIVEAATAAGDKARYARAAELFERAARVASAVTPPDSLVSINLRTRAATAILCQGGREAAPTDQVAAVTTAWQTVCELAPLLCARADADTLLPGKLRPDELAYARAIVPMNLRVNQSPVVAHSHNAAHLTMEKSQMLGYETALLAAGVVFQCFKATWQLGLPARRSADVGAANTLVLRSVALIAELGNQVEFRPGIEEQLAARVADVCNPAKARLYRGPVLDEHFYDALAALWCRPDVVAALEAHGTLDALADGSQEAYHRMYQESRERDIAAFGLRQCALPSCGAHEATVKQFKLCGGCKQVAYCCAEHSQAHWKEHKKTCSREDKQRD